jgi:hypothetical protein
MGYGRSPIRRRWQAMWRFLSNPRVTPKELAQPLRKAAREAVARQSGDWAPEGRKRAGDSTATGVWVSRTALHPPSARGEGKQKDSSGLVGAPSNTLTSNAASMLEASPVQYPLLGHPAATSCVSSLGDSHGDPSGMPCVRSPPASGLAALAPLYRPACCRDSRWVKPGQRRNGGNAGNAF